MKNNAGKSNGYGRWRGRTWMLACSLLLATVGTQAQSQRSAEAQNDTRSAVAESPATATRGTLWLQDEQGQRPLTSLDTQVDIKVTGMLARARVQQTFRNSGTSWAEALYVFPLPENAAVDRLRMQIGERVIEGQIKERGEAKTLYQMARKEGRRASLVEQERANIFTTSVANIGPGEVLQVVIEYQQTLRYVDGEFRLRFPLVVGPRYIPVNRIRSQTQLDAAGEGQGREPDSAALDAVRISPPVRSEEEDLGNPVRIRVDLRAGFPLQRVASVHHAIHTTEVNARSAVVELAAESVPADRDFELLWTPEPGSAPAAAWFQQSQGTEKYGLLMLMPPQGDPLAGDSLPRELVFVLDTSGSMHGDSIAQARQALLLALDRLRPVDRVNLIHFNQESHRLFASPQRATPEVVSRARNFVAGLQAEGGTEMLPAIRLALARDGLPEQDSDYLRQVVFLTDGSVSNEAELFAEIQSGLADSRLFTIGIGSAPNSHFMVKAAEYGRGTYTYIGDTRQVAERMQQLLRKLEQAAVTELELHSSVQVDLEIYPQRIPDLYLGEPMMLVFRGPELPPSVDLSGRLGGRAWHMEVPLQRGDAESAIAPEWARRRIESLTRQQHEAQNSQARTRLHKEIIATALEHHLVSQYTSLIAVETTPARPAQATLQQERVKTNLPKGWQHQAVFGTPATATSAPLRLLLGMLLLLASRYWFVLGRRQGG